VLCNLPYDFGNNAGENYGRRGKQQLVQIQQENHYRRMSKRGCVLSPPRGHAETGTMVLLALVAGWYRETGSIRAAVLGDEKPERVILIYRHRSGPSGEWEDVREPLELGRV
jgi:hypothetical protein